MQWNTGWCWREERKAGISVLVLNSVCVLIRLLPYPGPPLVSQEEANQFLASQLHPEALEAAAVLSGQELTLQR